MKTGVLILTLLALTASLHAASAPPALRFHRAGAGIELDWEATTISADGTRLRPIFELQRSSDLRNWRPVGERLRATAAAPDAWLRLSLGTEDPRAFYRVLTIVPTTGAGLAGDGAEVFGYAAAFADALARIGQISPEEFAARFPGPADYLPRISWDPTQAAFWDEFNADPAVVNQDKVEGELGYRTADYRLNAVERARLAENGFVVSERLGGRSFGEVFYRLWHNDLPVFISTDAILQAWHRTYDAILVPMRDVAGAN